MSILIPKCRSYTGNLNSETPGDSTNAFLHCGDVLVLHSWQLARAWSLLAALQADTKRLWRPFSPA